MSNGRNLVQEPAHQQVRMAASGRLRVPPPISSRSRLRASGLPPGRAVSTYWNGCFGRTLVRWPVWQPKNPPQKPAHQWVRLTA